MLPKYIVTNALKEEGKLRANWEDPYRVRETCKLETLGGKEIQKTWNMNNLKLYFSSVEQKCIVLFLDKNKKKEKSVDWKPSDLLR